MEIPKPTYTFSTKAYDFDQILSFYKHNRLDTSLDCQRGLVWTEKQKQDMIDTIVRRERIPEFHTIKEENESIFHFADGKQRITTAINFLTNQLPWKKIYANKEFYPLFGKANQIYFKDFPIGWQNAILNSALQFACYQNMTDSALIVLFRKLNSGTSLSNFAKMLSSNIYLKKYFLDDLMSHPVITKIFSNTDIEKDDAEMTLIRTYLLLKAWDKQHIDVPMDLTPKGLPFTLNLPEVPTDEELGQIIKELKKYQTILKQYLDIINTFEDEEISIRVKTSFHFFLPIYLDYKNQLDNNTFEDLYRFMITYKAANIVGSGADYGTTNIKKYLKFGNSLILENKLNVA